LVISPDAALHLVPFEMLRITGDVPLLQQFGVSYVPSVAVAYALWTAEPLRAGSVLALGDPRTPMGALPGARQEVVQIARRFPGTVVRMGPAASEALIKRPETGRVRLLHVGAHGVVNAWDGREAALQLTPGDGEDGVLFAGEIAGLALNGAVVVLSACQTNTGEIIDGEGVQGLTSAFLRAGARTVITTGWRIPDRDIVRLVDEFYARVASGRVVGEALREAQLASMTRGDPPQVWAAFRIVGDATRSLPSR
jgi:CHAT domain-containing protein